MRIIRPKTQLPTAGLHPRNRHPGRYDFKRLIAALPELARFVAPNPYGDASIDFANPEAVKTLNRALLKDFYGVTGWEVPSPYLCPPIPGRADYLHHAADLLATTNGGEIPKGQGVHVLDIGTGANGIYPIIGRSEYGWSFVGTDVDAAALEVTKKTIGANPPLASGIEFRLQTQRDHIFKGVVNADDRFDLTVCNPPFHSSAEEASEGPARKWRNLGKKPLAGQAPGRGREAEKPVLNFGGQGGELWCPGGEVAFIRKMVEESARIGQQGFWFTSLVSRENSLAAIYNALSKAQARDSRTVEMSHGQKKTRFIAWTFLTPAQQSEWNRRRG